MPLAVVTGVTGFVASELAKQLLNEGYNVRGTVRSVTAPRSVQMKDAIIKAVAKSSTSPQKASLELVEADLLKEGSFHEALGGADYLFHVASPFVIEVSDPQAQLIEPAVAGTRNVMLAAAQHKATLKRVVLTSSCAAVYDCHMRQVPKSGPDGKYTEEDFNETSTLEGSPPEGYWMSKVLAEKEAMRLAQEHGLSLVSILPNFIMGPALTHASAETSLSAGFLKGFLEAPEGKVPDGTWTISDVRDVARAHILAATAPEPSGRYIVSQDATISSCDITGFLKAKYPNLDIPDGAEHPVSKRVDNTKAPRELGLKLTPPQQSIQDMAAALIELGFAKPAFKQ